MTQAYFREENGAFIGQDPVRGPWSELHCHAGPVAGLAARAAEQAAGPDKMLTRLTLDITRAVPMAGVTVSVEVTRASRTLTTTRVSIQDLDGTICVSGSSMHLVRKDLGAVPTPQIAPPILKPDNASKAMFLASLHDKPVFGQFVETALAPGSGSGPGPKTIWMRTPPLLEGEAQSPIQSICALADCGNGISWNASTDEMGFMNTDLTLQIHREPVGDWRASEAISHWHGNGVGASHAVLYDTEGPVGVALQTLVLHPPKGA